MPSNSDSKFGKSIFDEEDRLSSPNRSMPSGGGGGIFTGRARSGAVTAEPGESSGGRSRSDAVTEEDEDSTTTTFQEEPEELEEQETLVSLTKVKFETPDALKPEESTEVSVCVEYLTDRTPANIEFQIAAHFGDEAVNSCIAEATITDGVAKTTIPLPLHETFYHKENKTVEDKIEYCVIAKCAQDDTEAVSESVMYPTSLLAIDIVEAPDSLFTEKGVIPCLDSEGKLIAVISKIFDHAGVEPDKEVVLYGHAAGEDISASNKISADRALALQAIIKNDSALWERAIGTNTFILDYQKILNCLTDFYDWGVHTGKEDGIDGENTQKGVKHFQDQYTEVTSNTLKIDGIVGPKTWKALLDTLHTTVLEVYGKAKVDLTYFADVNGIYGCGDAFPISDTLKSSYKSTTNERCEVGFHERPNPPALTAPAPDAKALASECQTYDDSLTDRTIITLDITAPDPSTPLGLEYPVKSKHKHYVNLTANNKDHGKTLIVKIKADDSKDNDTLYWRVTAGKDNSKRTDPKLGLSKVSDATVIPFTKKVLYAESKVTSKKSEMELHCGYAGGDTYTVEVGTVKGKYKVEAIITNWRKLWYQLTHHSGAAVPSMATVESYMKKEKGGPFLEFEKDSAVPHTEGAAGSVIIGNHNAATFHALLNTTHNNQCCNIIFCDKQYDGLSGGSNLTFTKAKQFSSLTKDIRVASSAATTEIFSPPIQTGATLLVSGSWDNPATGDSGNLTDDPALVDVDTGLVVYKDKRKVTVTLPAKAAPTATDKVAVVVEVTGASGPWGGDGGTAPHNLIVIDTNDTIHSMCVMHELGHLINMVPEPSRYACPPGFVHADHSHSYVGRGGAGSHCSHDCDPSTTPALVVDGKCIMFHQLNYNCTLEYCPDCLTFVKAQNLTGFHVI